MSADNVSCVCVKIACLYALERWKEWAILTQPDQILDHQLREARPLVVNNNSNRGIVPGTASDLSKLC